MLGSKILFALDARTDLLADEKELIKKYALGKLVVYDSEARKKHADAAYGHFDNAATTPGLSASSAGRLRVTVDGLVSGQHIECKDLDELLGAEAAIVEACKNIKVYLETAVTFDGREEVIEF
jgi:hypothetical protein